MAEVVVGRLEVQWGDVANGIEAEPAKLRVALVTGRGVRYALDSASATRAAGDLHGLTNRWVAVELSRQAVSVELRHASVIVPIDRPWLSPLSKSLLTPSPVLGNTRWITLACKFKDVADEPRPTSFFQEQYGTSVGQLGHYWSEVSQGKINLQGSQAYGWFTLPKTRSQYMNVNGSGQEQANLGLLFDDCAALADPSVDFAGVRGINMMFNAILDGSAWGGTSCGTLDGRSVCLGTTWNPPWSFNNLALFAHEMGHGYGLPHSDNSDGDADTYDNPWDLMSDYWSNALDHSRYGRLPKHLSVPQQDRLGWFDAPRKLTVVPSYAPVDVTLDRSSLVGSSNIQMLVLPEPLSQDGYSIEVRKRTGPGSYESQLAGDAVIIHKIGPSNLAYSVDADQPPATISNNEGSMFKVGEQWRSPGNSVVRIKAATSEGFIVEVNRARVTGGNLPPRSWPATPQ
ncbi:hypothetical protein [Pseudoxanthomonas sp. CF125]|uniref:hypothetical protein n=1 Tax=Pseudoxanthomonas sp. CF125 TaxID=1855303 RepID=UPI0008880EA0|nr:hypothetical protein [Pseudoxanthomonas sp. CF125]SDQ81785.1 M6 family metalloprotease domain-containing protein [Pseudoxanthomonas sp. CF125]